MGKMEIEEERTAGDLVQCGLLLKICLQTGLGVIYLLEKEGCWL